MNYYASAIIPLTVALLALYGLVKKVDIFDCFIEGATDGIEVCFKILPTLIGLLTAIGMFRASGALDFLCDNLSFISVFLGIPKETIPLALVRPISGGLATGMFRDILSTYGVDTYIGKVASVMLGSTETTLYTIAVYYGAIGIKKTRHTLSTALLCDIVGFIMSAVAVRLLI